jgi:hypothetical protein
MDEEIERLHESASLHGLLSHYVEAGAADREAWQDRRMQLDGTRAEELVRLHGELIAHGWVEQNTGVTPELGRGGVPCCYRATPAGRSALKQARADRQDAGPGREAA